MFEANVTRWNRRREEGKKGDQLGFSFVSENTQEPCNTASLSIVTIEPDVPWHVTDTWQSRDRVLFCHTICYSGQH